MKKSFKVKGFPFLFGGTFIEGKPRRKVTKRASNNFPSFSEGLSLRVRVDSLALGAGQHHFPSFSEGLSLRGIQAIKGKDYEQDFPSFSEGLSLRASATSRW